MFQFPFPVFITTEDKWFVAECPLLQIATQGKTEHEVKENMEDLIKEHLQDKDTPKVFLKDIPYTSLSYISVAIPNKLVHGQT
jgi:predicted RNase H-like HicB family nuclease